MMKTRNRIIVFLAIIGVVLFGLVQGVIIPKNNQKNNEYITRQQKPTTHDLNSVLKYKNKYMGNSSNITNLFHTLPLNNIQMYFELFPDKLIAQVNYKDTIEKINENKVNQALIYNSTVAFALIDNLQGINYNFANGGYKVQRSDVKKWYGKDLSSLLEKDEWRNEVQEKLKDNEYINKCTKAILKKQ